MKPKLLLATLFFAAFGCLPVGLAAQYYTVDTEASSLKWEAYKPLGGHYGSIRLSAGLLERDGQVVTFDKITIDMESISVEDLDGSSKDRLLSALRSDDFFHVAKYEKATLEYLSHRKDAESGQLIYTANLTLTGITKEITVYVADSKVTDELIRMKGRATLNRQDWELIFDDGLVRKGLDPTVKDEFDITFNLVARLP